MSNEPKVTRTTIVVLGLITIVLFLLVLGVFGAINSSNQASRASEEATQKLAGSIVPIEDSKYPAKLRVHNFEGYTDVTGDFLVVLPKGSKVIGIYRHFVGRSGVDPCAFYIVYSLGDTSLTLTWEKCTKYQGRDVYIDEIGTMEED